MFYNILAKALSGTQETFDLLNDVTNFPPIGETLISRNYFFLFKYILWISNYLYFKGELKSYNVYNKQKNYNRYKENVNENVYFAHSSLEKSLTLNGEVKVWLGLG